MWKDFIRIAHRGASGLAPENTLAAFAKALEIGVDAVELEVHATKDRRVVVIHDGALDRTTNAKGKVSELTLAEILKADAGIRFGKEFSQEKIPILNESLDLIKGNAITVVEIKQKDIAGEVVKAIEDTSALDDVVVISFHPSVLCDVRQIKPRIPTGLLIGANAAEKPYAQGIEYVHKTAEVGASTLSLSHPAVTPELARAVRERGVNLWTWTIDDVDRMREVLDCGVEGITSNYPDRFKQRI